MNETAASRLTTLIVDGNEAFLRTASAWCANRPELEVVGTARSGKEALDAVDRLDPDLVVVDAVLPGFDGFGFVRELKARPGAPVVVVTMFLAGSPARDAAHAAGADGFIAKDDFAGAFDLLLADLFRSTSQRETRLRLPERSDRPGSRTEPTP
jgi:two-component system chemotaxis response regulator CheB